MRPRPLSAALLEVDAAFDEVAESFNEFDDRSDLPSSPDDSSNEFRSSWSFFSGGMYTGLNGCRSAADFSCSSLASRRFSSASSLFFSTSVFVTVGCSLHMLAASP